MVTKAFAKYIFDKSKIEVVGNPVITEDGIASGFSKDNYVTKVLPVSLTNNDEIIIEGDIPAGTTTAAQAIFCIDNVKNLEQLMLFIDRGQVVFRYNGEFGLNAQLRYNAAYSYKYKAIVKQKTVELLIKEENSPNFVSTGVKTASSNFTVNVLKFGVAAQNASPFLSKLPLSTYKISLNGKLIYSPTRPITYLERKKKGFDKSKFTVIGSPNITTGGVVNKFSYTSYVSIPNSIVSKIETTSWKISFMGISPSSNTTLNITGVSVTSKGKLNIGWINNTSNFFLQLKNSTVEKAVYVRTNNPNTPFIGYAEFDGTDNYTIAISFDGGVTFSKNTMTAGERVNFERADLPIATGLDSATGSIDLKSILVESGNKEIFNGQIEKYYALQV